MASFMVKTVVILIALNFLTPALSKTFDLTNNVQDDATNNFQDGGMATFQDDVTTNFQDGGMATFQDDATNNFQDGGMATFQDDVTTNFQDDVDPAKQYPESSEVFDDLQTFESFNRPVGTVALQTPMYTTNGITSGKYGSYRKQQGWLQAVSSDVLRHRIMHGNSGRQTVYPWMVKNMHTPSLVGFGVNGFWNSYAPTMQGGLHRTFSNANAAKRLQLGRN